MEGEYWLGVWNTYKSVLCHLIRCLNSFVCQAFTVNQIFLHLSTKKYLLGLWMSVSCWQKIKKLIVVKPFTQSGVKKWGRNTCLYLWFEKYFHYVYSHCATYWVSYFRPTLNLYNNYFCERLILSEYWYFTLFQLWWLRG